jgi:hypothetical protein
MKINRKNLKLTPIRLMVSAGLIMASFLSEASAFLDCTRLRCDKNWEKCKTDSAYFNECNTKCPEKTTEKCRKAHEEATRVKLAHPGNVLKISCEEAKRLIEVQEELFRLKVAKEDYTPEELKFLLRNCSTGAESPAATGSPATPESPASGKAPKSKAPWDVTAAVQNDPKLAELLNKRKEKVEKPEELKK